MKVGDKYDPKYGINDGCLRLPFGYEFWWCYHCFSMDIRKHEIYNGKCILMNEDCHKVYTVKNGVVINVEVEE